MAVHIPVPKLVALLEEASKGGRLYASVADGRLALGADPTNPSLAIDLSIEALVPYRRDVQPIPSTIRSVRKSGAYWMELMGERQEFGSLRDLLAGSLRAIEGLCPGTLEKLSQIKPRSKRIVSHDRALLFDSPEMVEKYSVELMSSWWYGTNNSADETRTWLQRACSCADLQWDDDFRTNI